MKKWIIILLCVYINVEAQIDIQYLNDVPESFKKEYFKKPREYNPLHVGDVWQYKQDGVYMIENIINDTLVNEIKYFKRIIDFDERLVSWERSDSTGNSFMLDFEDIDEDGNYNEELPIDSLELPLYSRYKTYKGSYKFLHPPKEGYSALIYDTLWVAFNKDTVLAKNVQYDFCFCTAIICDKYGVIMGMGDANVNEITGMIINGKQYGIIVDVKEIDNILPEKVKLENNYPNPFNPVTTIDYSIPVNGMVTIKVFDTLGKEVATLINERKSVGNYSVKFNAANLPSGVYYYTLITDSKRITKSMILLK